MIAVFFFLKNKLLKFPIFIASFSIHFVLFFCVILFSKQRITLNRTPGRNINENEVPTSNNNNNNRLSWPQFYQRNRNNNSNNSKNIDEERRRKESTGNSSSTNAVALERVLGLDEARAIQKANQIVMYVQNSKIWGKIVWWWIFSKHVA